MEQLLSAGTTVRLGDCFVRAVTGFCVMCHFNEGVSAGPQYSIVRFRWEVVR
jgi:hypothetical protein